MQRTWPEYYLPPGPGDPKADLMERCRKTGLPIEFAAVSQDDQVIGSGTLAGKSYGSLAGEEPWITGLFVHPELRGQGIASALVQALEEQTSVAGFSQVFTTTQTAAGLLIKAGWQELRRLASEKGVWTVMTKTL